MESENINLSSCKLIEIGENGELKLVKDNLHQLLKHFREKLDNKNNENLPIAVVSVLGPSLSGKSFFTNLLIEYLKHGGKTWTKGITSQGTGLKGFPYGSEDNLVVSGKKPDEELTSGVYVWPQLFPLYHCNGHKLLCLMHVVNQKPEVIDGDQQKPVVDPLNVLLEIASSRVLDIVWKEMSVTETLLNLNTTDMQTFSSHLCRSVLHLHRQTSEKTDWKASTSNEEKVVTMPYYTKPLHNKNGIVIFSTSQIRLMEKLIRQLIDETNLTPKKFETGETDLKIEHFPQFLNSCLGIINSCRVFKYDTRHSRSTLFSRIRTKSNDLNEDSDHNADITAGWDQTDESHEKKENSNSLLDHLMNREVDEIINGLSKISFENEENKNLPAENKAADLQKYKEELLSRPFLLTLHGSLEKRIAKELKRENIEEIKGLFDSTVDLIIEHNNRELITKGLSDVQAREVIEDVKKILENEAKEIKQQFIKLTESLEQFCGELDSKFETTLFFSPDKLNGFVKSTTEKISVTIGDSQIRDFFEIGVIKLALIYANCNERMIQREKNISMECIKQIMIFYQHEMQNLVPPNQYVRPGTLSQVHQRLLPDLLSIYKKSLNTSKNISENVSDLKRQLNDAFFLVEQRNMGFIEIKQRNVKSFILKWKKEYEVALDELLEQYPDGLEQEKFDAKADEIEREMIQNFEIEGRKNLQGQYLYQYLQAFKKYNKKTKRDFGNENGEKLQDCLDKTKECAPGPSREDKNESNKSNDRGNTATQAKTTDENDHPPLLIQLGPEHFYVGVICYNATENVKVNYISPEVGLTKEDEWVCGNEVKKLISSHSPEIFSNWWHIGKHLFSNTPVNEHAIVVNQEPFQIRIEFLLAILLKYIKKSIEEEQSGNISSITVAVPIWYTSNKRQLVLDSAQIAGFLDVQIVNENSVAAYYMYESGQDDHNLDTVVLSENSGAIDIAIYSYKKQKASLSMLGHFGETCTNIVSNANAKGWLETFGQLLSQFAPFSQSEVQEDESTIQQIVKLCDCTITKTKRQNRLSQNKMFLIFGQSEKWITLLTNAMKSYVSDRFISTQSHAVMFGLKSVHQTLSLRKVAVRPENMFQDKLPYHVKISWSSPKYTMFPKTHEIHDVDHRTARFHLAKSEVYTISEINIFSKVEWPITVLNMIRFDNFSNGILAVLKRSNQGIVTLQDIKWSQKNWCKKPMEKGAFRWNSFTMSKHDREKCIDHMSVLRFYKDVLVRIKTERKLLLEKCDFMDHCIEEGKGTVSPLLKGLVQSQLKEMVEQLKNPEITENELLQKRKFLDSISTKYKLV